MQRGKIRARLTTRSARHVVTRTAPSAEQGARRAAHLSPTSASEIVDLVLRLSRVMEAEYVATWLARGDIESLEGRTQLDLIVQGRIDLVAQIASALEDPGAS